MRSNQQNYAKQKMEFSTKTVTLFMAAIVLVYMPRLSSILFDSGSRIGTVLPQLSELSTMAEKQHVIACDRGRLEKIVRIRQNTSSNCPDRTPWWLEFAGQFSEGRHQPLIHVNIGCNKGIDFLATLHDLSGDEQYSPLAYMERLEAAGKPFDNGACGQGLAIHNRLRPTLKSTRKVNGYCIEPANKTFQVLLEGMKTLENQGVHLGQYVMHSSPGEVFFPDVSPGVEASGYSQSQGLPIRATTFDDYAKAMGIDHIDLLSIDTEGNDMHVLYGALNFLVNRLVRVLEFEVHTVGHWAISRVDNVLAVLDNIGFICYWHLVGTYPLLRATGCMAEELETSAIKQWSNMVCVNRAEKEVAGLFESLSLEAESTLG